MYLERFENAEPAALVGLLTGLGGFVVSLAADFSLAHAAALAAGMSGTQALLTRPVVFSPKSISDLEQGSGLSALKIPELLRTGSSLPNPQEPALTVGTLTVVGGFLVQLFCGVDLATALASAGGIGLVQTTATRSRVSSPLTARRVASISLAAESASQEVSERSVIAG